MLQSERHRKILHQLKMKQAVKVKDLAAELSISAVSYTHLSQFNLK